MSARNEAKERLMDELAAMSDDEFEARCKRITAEINARHKPIPPRSLVPCTWRKEGEFWESICGLSWWNLDGAPAVKNMKYCPKCGSAIVEVTP